MILVISGCLIGAAIKGMIDETIRPLIKIWSITS